ncbi:MAG: polysaccharide pyruvyl transferase family protein [Bacteroidota bacterium]
MKPLTIEINNHSKNNRGDELMAIAMIEKLRELQPEARLVGNYNIDTRKRLANGLYVTHEIPGRPGRFFAKLVRISLKHGTDALRERLGVVKANEIDVVLDASGFRFSDKWPVKEDYGLFKKMNGSYRRNKPLILMPQALGPFKKPETAKAAKRLFERAENVYARDSYSFDEAKQLGESPKIKKCPDMTILVAPIFPNGHFFETEYAVIVPNYRMVDKTKSGDKYKELIHFSIETLKKKNINPVFLLHEYHDNDRNLLKEINKKYNLPVLEHEDPRVLKGMLAKATIVIGSRFHSLVSALSTGVPAIGTGWAHKYEELFKDFGVPELLLKDVSDLDYFEKLISSLDNKEKREEWKHKLLLKSEELKSQINTMWSEVNKVLMQVKDEK